MYFFLKLEPTIKSQHTFHLITLAITDIKIKTSQSSLYFKLVHMTDYLTLNQGLTDLKQAILTLLKEDKDFRRQVRSLLQPSTSYRPSHHSTENNVEGESLRPTNGTS